MRVLYADINGNQIQVEKKTTFAEIWKLAAMDHVWKSGI